jgi:hypothetical protein
VSNIIEALQAQDSRIDKLARPFGSRPVIEVLEERLDLIATNQASPIVHLDGSLSFTVTQSKIGSRIKHFKKYVEAEFDIKVQYGLASGCIPNMTRLLIFLCSDRSDL